MLAEKNTYLFHVAKRATKQEVSQAVYHTYGIRPTRVRVMNLLGKQRRHGQTRGRTSDWKKAIVTLPADKKIEVYEGV